MKKIFALSFLVVIVFGCSQPNVSVNTPVTKSKSSSEVLLAESTQNAELNEKYGFAAENTWKQYVNYDLGFSFYFPAEATFTIAPDNYQETTIFEEENILHLTLKKYCDLELDPECKNPKKNNLALVTGDEYLHAFNVYYGKATIVEELEGLVQRLMGKECSIKSEKDMKGIDQYFLEAAEDSEPGNFCHTGKAHVYFSPQAGVAVFYVVANGGGRDFYVKTKPDVDEDLYPFDFAFGDFSE